MTLGLTELLYTGRADLPGPSWTSLASAGYLRARGISRRSRLRFVPHSISGWFEHYPNDGDLLLLLRGGLPAQAEAEPGQSNAGAVAVAEALKRGSRAVLAPSLPRVLPERVGAFGHNGKRQMAAREELPLRMRDLKALRVRQQTRRC